MAQIQPSPFIVGILLAAGFSRRFGQQDKLLHPLNNGLSMAETSAQNLVEVLPSSVAVVRQKNIALQASLVDIGCTIAQCDDNAITMADSLRLGILAAKTAFPQATGYVIALADMPFIQAATIRKVATQLETATIVQPVFDGQRGHPVGFSSRLTLELLAIHGDQGARQVVQAHQNEVLLLACDDADILRDIDTLADLA